MIDEKQLQKAVAEAQERSAKQSMEKLVDIHTRIITISYDRATAYTNVIIVAGYAAFFGLWSLTKGQVSKPIALWAALLMCISATTFVFYEVYKMIWVGRALNEQYLTLTERIKGKPAVAQLKEFEALEANMRKMSLSFVPVWRIVLMLAVSTGFFALALLVASFIKALFFDY